MEAREHTPIRGTAVAVDGNDIDTDRIIPARYLRAVTFDGLGEHAFEDDRRALATTNTPHPFDDPRRQSAEVLVVGRNFGCGSSREHAPQALKRWGGGLKALVGESFSEIFFANCVALGMACLTAEPAELEALAAAVRADPNLTVEIDLERLEARFGGNRAKLSMPEGARRTLLSGNWDSTRELLENREATERVARTLPYLRGFA